MTAPLFFCKDISTLKVSSKTQTTTLSNKELFRHIISSQRHKVSDLVNLTDGVSYAGSFEITRILEGSNAIEMKLLASLPFERPFPAFTIAQGVIKSPADTLAIDLLTQAGVSKIIPWQANRSISKYKEGAARRWQNQIISSSEQSRRTLFPLLLEPLNSKQLVKYSVSNKGSVFLLDENLGSEAGPPPLHPTTLSLSYDLKSCQIGKENVKIDDLLKTPEILIIVGPEGGIDQSEYSNLLEAGVRPLGLGTNILRSSFAGAAALIGIQTLLGKV